MPKDEQPKTLRQQFQEDARELHYRGVIPLEELAVLKHGQKVRRARRVILR